MRGIRSTMLGRTMLGRTIARQTIARQTMVRRWIGDERGTSLIEMLVAMVLFGVVITGILPLMMQASQQDRGSRNNTIASSLATEIMETLRYYRSLAILGTVTPPDVIFAVNDPTDDDDYHTIDGTGTWAALGVDPDFVDMSYRLTNDPLSGALNAQVRVRVRDGGAVNIGRGGEKWVEFTSAL